MKRIGIIASTLLALCMPSSALAGGDVGSKVKGWKTYDSMGCMMLRECTDGVKPVVSLMDVSKEYDNWEEFTIISAEFNSMVNSLNQVGVGVYLADSKYFPVGHRGVYHTVGNNFFLNKEYMDNPGVLMSVMRHEGWHAAQDCMAGTINNSLVAIIKPEEEVPPLWRGLAERTYPSAAVPWEAEAGWAGRTEGMTRDALAACANGNMWEQYEPTPKTREWLQLNGYLD
tara:strand:+ start:1184 stop:1867 length:684 start_codon:yes stop_codon:yes gene_type:complete